jgi:hypothetical protein
LSNAGGLQGREMSEAGRKIQTAGYMRESVIVLFLIVVEAKDLNASSSVYPEFHASESSYSQENPLMGLRDELKSYSVCSSNLTTNMEFCPTYQYSKIQGISRYLIHPSSC